MPPGPLPALPGAPPPPAVGVVPGVAPAVRPGVPVGDAFDAVPDGVPGAVLGDVVEPLARTRIAREDGETLPAASCCRAVTACVPPLRTEPSVEQRQRPSSPTRVRQTGARSTYAVTVAPGSPEPAIVVPTASIVDPDRGVSMRGADGGVRSSVTVRGVDAALRRSDR